METVSHSYDTKCYDLAKAFLSDEPALDTEPNRDDLAQSIQDAIESTIEAMRTPAVEFYEGTRNPIKKDCACGGSGVVPAVHPDAADENGYERCPDCNPEPQ